MPKTLTNAKIRFGRCFNPFKLNKHSSKSRLRRVTADQLRAVDVSVTTESLQQKICDACRRRIRMANDEEEVDNRTDQVEIVCI